MIPAVGVAAAVPEAELGEQADCFYWSLKIPFRRCSEKLPGDGAPVFGAKGERPCQDGAPVIRVAITSNASGGCEMRADDFCESSGNGFNWR
jgi:hypothetical protein